MNIISSQRHLFEVPEDISYFNCAYNSPQLKESSNRLIAGVQSKNSPWNRSAEDFFSDAETIRKLASELFFGDPDGFAITPSASYGISAAARIIEPYLKSGDQILLMAEDFPSNVFPWQRTAKETKAEVVTVPKPANGNWTVAIQKLISAKTKVVAVSSCHWTDGAFVDLVSIGESCRQHGCLFLIDATQSLGAMPFSIQKIKPNFLVAAGYKWLLCPYGFGIFYVSEDWRQGRPLEEHWLARANSKDFKSLSNYSYEYLPGARKFDVGETCAPTILPGAIAALEQIKAWGVENIYATLGKINLEIAEKIDEHGLLFSEREFRAAHILSVQLAENLNTNLVTKLKENNVFASQRGNFLRVAPHLHVNGNDIDKLVIAMKALN